MQLLIGTSTGLVRLDGDGHREVLLKGDVRTTNGRWAIVDDEVISVDGGMRVALDETPLSLATGSFGALIGTARARLFDAQPGSSTAAAVASFDAIPTRDQWYTPWGGPPDCRSVTVAGDGSALVNVHVGGVWRSGDDGGWDEVVDVERDTHQVLAGADGSTIVIAAAVGFGHSSDGGHTFTWTASGLHDTYCRAVAIADDVVLVTASTGPFTQHAAVYVRELARDDPFVRCDNGLPEWFTDNIDTFQMAARGSDVVIGTGDGRLFASDDRGSSWDLAADGFEPVRSVEIVS